MKKWKRSELQKLTISPSFFWFLVGKGKENNLRKNSGKLVSAYFPSLFIS